MKAVGTANRFSLMISTGFVLLYTTLFLLFTQLHELSHILTGRLVCGCFGAQQDFNTWTLCGDCESRPNGFLPTLAGPVFSYTCIWTGVYLLRAKSWSTAYAGFVLVFVNHPFARLFTILIKGGDELVVARTLLSGRLPDTMIWIMTLSVIVLLTVPPLYRCYKILKNKRRLLLVAALCLLPMIFQYFYQFILLNKLLRKGVGLNNPVMGIANLIHWHTLLLLLFSFLLYRYVRNSQAALIGK